MTLLCSSQMDFSVCSPPAVSLRGEIRVRQNVAGNAEGSGARRIPALSAVVAHLLSTLGDLFASARARGPIASFQPLLCCSPAKLRSPCLLKSGETFHGGDALARLRCSVHTLLKVSSCAVLTQSRNSGNNLQLSEKHFRRSEIAFREFRRRRATGRSVKR